MRAINVIQSISAYSLTCLLTCLSEHGNLLDTAVLAVVRLLVSYLYPSYIYAWIYMSTKLISTYVNALSECCFIGDSAACSKICRWSRHCRPRSVQLCQCILILSIDAYMLNYLLLFHRKWSAIMATATPHRSACLRDCLTVQDWRVASVGWGVSVGHCSVRLEWKNMLIHSGML